MFFRSNAHPITGLRLASIMVRESMPYVAIASGPILIYTHSNRGPGESGLELGGAIERYEEGRFFLLACHMVQRLIRLRAVREGAADTRAETDCNGCSLVCRTQPSLARGLRSPKERILYPLTRAPWSPCRCPGESRREKKP